jgi:hypothetical protein
MSLHNKKRSLGFLLNGIEQFPVKQFTLFVSLLTRAPSAYMCAHDVCIIQRDIHYTSSFGAAAQRRPESLMLGTEHRIYCIQFGSKKPAPGEAAAAA